MTRKPEFASPEVRTVCAVAILIAILLTYALFEFLGRALYGFELQTILFIRKIPLALALASPALLLGPLGRWYAAGISTISGVLCMAQLECMALFAAPFDREIFDVFSLTTPAEMTVFLKTFATPLSLGILAGMSIAIIAFVRAAFRISYTISPKLALLAAILFLPAILQGYRILKVHSLSLDDFLSKNSLTRFILQFGEFDRIQTRLRNSINTPVFPPDLKRSSWIDSDFLGVVLVGESTSRHHMGLYGYARQTTPQLQKIRQELLVFDDFISAFATTGESLKASLVPGIYQAESPWRYTAVNLARASGYRVDVLSNQERIGYHNAALNLLFGDASSVSYLMRERSTDQVLLDGLGSVLTKGTGPRLVIAHMMGTHMAYTDRYPPGFHGFTGAPPLAPVGLSPDKVQTINAYDTAVRFTDTVVAGFIEAVRATGRPGFVLYFSDHGEALYEDGTSFFHAANVANRYMYDIPLLLWISAPYSNKEPEFVAGLKQRQKLPLQATELTPMFMELMRVSSEALGPGPLTSGRIRSRSIAGQDYDALFREDRNSERDRANSLGGATVLPPRRNQFDDWPAVDPRGSTLRAVRRARPGADGPPDGGPVPTERGRKRSGGAIHIR